MFIVIIGGGICGLGAALLLARDGHDVTVLERDPDPLPDSPARAWDVWARRGVAQFRQPHNFMPGLRLLLESELPDLPEALRRAGGSRLDLLHPLPPSITDASARAIDAALWTVTARRPAGEWVFADAAARQPRITIRRGVEVSGLLAGPSVVPGVPHVEAVRTETGEQISADLVVDATGRHSRSPAWLAALGARPPYEEQEDCGFIYYTRYFGGQQPERRGPVLTALGTLSLLTLPGDNGTWSVTMVTSAGDQPLKNLRHDDTWGAVVRACPLHAHWLDGEPLTSVLPMAGVVDRYRRFTWDGVPIATGIVAVADAWACTNPSAGRGLTVGFIHAQLLRNVVRETADDPAAIVREFDRRTEIEVAPWYRAQIAVDRTRFAEIEALREGREPSPPADELARGAQSLLATMTASPDLFRAALEYIATITPVQHILERPDVIDGIRTVRAAMKGPPRPMPGPTRAQLLALME